MTMDELEKAIALTGHERYRWLTSDANPDARSRELYRAEVARLASGATGEPRSVAHSVFSSDGCCGGGVDLNPPPGPRNVMTKGD